MAIEQGKKKSLSRSSSGSYKEAVMSRQNSLTVQGGGDSIRGEEGQVHHSQVGHEEKRKPYEAVKQQQQQPQQAQATSNWYYKDFAGEHGPRTLPQLMRAVQKGYFNSDLLVRKEGTWSWHTLKEIMELRQAVKEKKKAAENSHGAHVQQPTQPSKTVAVAAVSAGGAGVEVQKQKAASVQNEVHLEMVSLSAPVVDDDAIGRLFEQPDQSGTEDAWFYIDLEGKQQGPFKSSRMAKWWSSPQYRGHFSSLTCRNGSHGEFKLLSEIAMEKLKAARQSSSAAQQLPVPQQCMECLRRKASAMEERAQMNAAKEEAEAEVQKWKAKTKEMEDENQRLRNSQDDTLMLRMQVEKLHKEKAELAREVTTLKREKEGLQELLEYAQHFVEEDDESLILDLEAAEGMEEEDPARDEWLKELQHGTVIVNGREVRV